MPDIDIGDYELDEDSNGNLVIKDSNDNTVLQWDASIPAWTFGNSAIEGISSLSTDSINNIDGNPMVHNDNDVLSDGSTVRLHPTVDRPDARLIVRTDDPRTGFFYVGQRGTSSAEAFDSGNFGTAAGSDPYNVFLNGVNVTVIENNSGSETTIHWTLYFAGIEP